MAKKYQIFELEEIQMQRTKTFSQLAEPDEIALLGKFDTLEEAEEAIIKYGYDYINYSILPIYRTDRKV